MKKAINKSKSIKYSKYTCKSIGKSYCVKEKGDTYSVLGKSNHGSKRSRIAGKIGQNSPPLSNSPGIPGSR